MQGKSRVSAVFMIFLNDEILFNMVIYYVFGKTLINTGIYQGEAVFMHLF